jgi:hypothetical protein
VSIHVNTHTLTFDRICDEYPELEYLFGSFLSRPNFIREPDTRAAIRQFMRLNPEMVPDTLRQLLYLVVELRADAYPERAAASFLQELGCTVRFEKGYSALAWLEAIPGLLRQRSASIRADVDPGYGGPLLEPIPLIWQSDPLHLVSVFLRGVRSLGHCITLHSILFRFSSYVALAQTQPEQLLETASLRNVSTRLCQKIIPLSEVSPT